MDNELSKCIYTYVESCMFTYYNTNFMKAIIVNNSVGLDTSLLTAHNFCGVYVIEAGAQGTKAI